MGGEKKRHLSKSKLTSARGSFLEEREKKEREDLSSKEKERDRKRRGRFWLAARGQGGG